MENEDLARIWLIASTDGELNELDRLRFDNLWLDLVNTQRSNFVRANVVADEGLAKQAALSLAVEMNQSSLALIANATETVQAMKYIEPLSSLFDQDLLFNDQEWAFINDRNAEGFRQFENTAAYYAWKHTIFEGHYEELLSMAGELVRRIDAKLEK